MHQSGLDSSILSSFFPEPDIDHPHIFPPSGDVHLDPYSEEYFQKLVETLDLDTFTYSHLSSEILTQFKVLLRKYPTAFYLPGAVLHPIRGFNHNIHTSDAPPVYCMSYHRSLPKLAAIKEELKSEKGVPQPPRFVVDYRGLNTMTVGDGHSIPSVSNILDALSGG